MDEREQWLELIIAHNQTIAALRERDALRRDRQLLRRQQLDDNERTERIGIAAQRESEITLLRTMMLSDAASLASRDGLLARVSTALQKAAAAEEARSKLQVLNLEQIAAQQAAAIQSTAKQNRESFDVVSASVKELQQLLAATASSSDKTGGFNAVEFLVTRLRLLGKEEATARDFMEDLQLSFRRQIVGMCSAVFLSPFRMARTSAATGTVDAPSEGRSKSIPKARQLSAHRRRSSSEDDDDDDDRRPRSIRHSTARQDPENGLAAAGAVPMTSSPPHSVMAVIREEAESLERSRRLMHVFRHIGYDLPTASRYSTLFTAAGFASAIDLDSQRMISFGVDENRGSEDDRGVLAVLADLTGDDLKQVGLLTIGEQRTLAARVKAAMQRLFDSDEPASAVTRRPRRLSSEVLDDDKREGESVNRHSKMTTLVRDEAEAAAGRGEKEEEEKRRLPSPSPLPPQTMAAPRLLASPSVPVETSSPARSVAGSVVSLRDLDEYYQSCKSKMVQYDHAIHTQWDHSSRHARHEPEEPMWQAEWRRACIADLKEEGQWENAIVTLRHRLQYNLLSSGELSRLTADVLPVPYAQRSNSSRGELVRMRQAGMRCPRRL